MLWIYILRNIGFLHLIKVTQYCLGHTLILPVFEGDSFVMAEQLELHNIVGHAANGAGDHVYDNPLASIEEDRYEQLQNDRSNDSATNRTGDVDNGNALTLKSDLHKSAFRKLQILWAVLLTIIVMSSSVTIGVLIYKLVSLM